MNDRVEQIKESIKRWARMKGLEKLDIEEMMKRWGMAEPEKETIDLSKVDWGKVAEDIEFVETT